MIGKEEQDNLTKYKSRTDDTVKHLVLDNGRLKLLSLILVIAILVVFAFQNAAANNNEVNVDRIIDIRKSIKAGEIIDDIDDLVIINTGINDIKNVKKNYVTNLTVLHFDNEQQSVYPIQIQGMTYARFEENGTKYKLDGGMLREAYTTNDPNILLNAISNMTDIDVNHYLVIDYITIIRLVDQMQFIRLNVKESEIQEINKNQQALYNQLGIGTMRRVKVSGVQPLNGIQAAAYAMMKGNGGESKYDRRQTKNFTKVICRIIASMKKSNMADLMKMRNIVLDGDNNIDNDYLVDATARLLSFKTADRVTWPSSYVFKTYNGVRYKFANTVSENARKLHVEVFGETGYEPSEKVKECNAFNKNMLSRIEEIRKQKEEEERLKKEEEERQRLEEEAARLAEEYAEQYEEENDDSGSTKKKDSKNSKKDSSSSKKKKDSSKEESSKSKDTAEEKDESSGTSEEDSGSGSSGGGKHDKPDSGSESGGSGDDAGGDEGSGED